MHPEIFVQSFQEELYRIPPMPVVALPMGWQDIPESDKILLEKILKLGMISLNHVKIIIATKPDVLAWNERPNQVIAFGLDAPGLSQNELLDIQGIKLIVTSKLAELESAPLALKQKLTAALKQMFQPLASIKKM